MIGYENVNMIQYYVIKNKNVDIKFSVCCFQDLTWCICLILPNDVT
jgi:hypothetical protein